MLLLAFSSFGVSSSESVECTSLVTAMCRIIQTDKERSFIMTANHTDWLYDEDLLDVYSLFQGGDPDLYRLDGAHCDQLQSPLLEYNDADEEHLPIEYYPHISTATHKCEDGSAGSSSMLDLDAMQFLNFEGCAEHEYVAKTRSLSGPNLDLDNSTWPSIVTPSCCSLNPAAEEAHDTSMQDYEVAATKFVRATDSITDDHHQSPSQPSIRAKDGDGAQGDSPCAAGGPDQLAPATPSRKASHQEPLQCPRCHSRNTKFCYYNNSSLNQPRHLCRGCQKQWTVGGTLRPGNAKSSAGVKKPVRRKRSRKDGAQTDEDGVKGPWPEDEVGGGVLRTRNGVGPPSRGRGPDQEPGGTGTRQRVMKAETRGRKRKSEDSNSALASMELGLSFLPYPAGETSIIAAAASSNPSLDFSKLPSIPDVRKNDGRFPPSPSANFVPLPSAAQNAMIPLAQNPRLSSTGEADRGFPVRTPNNNTAPCSVSELRKQYGPVTVSLLYQLNHIETLAAPNYQLQLKIPMDLQFNHVGLSNSNPIARRERGRPDTMGTAVGTSATGHGNESERVSEVVATTRDLNLSMPGADSTLKGSIVQSSQIVTSPPELGESCEFDIDRGLLPVTTDLQCTCAAAAPSSSQGKAMAKLPGSAEGGEFDKRSMRLTWADHESAISASTSPKRPKRLPSRLGINQEDGVDWS